MQAAFVLQSEATARKQTSKKPPPTTISKTANALARKQTSKAPLIPQTTMSGVAKTRAQVIFSNLVLLLAISAVISTVLATTSGDVILQVLSQTELVPVQTNGQASSSKNNRVAIVYEPYGYVSLKDDTGKAGFLRFLSHASFYEYRLPRAILKVSQHKEELTLKQSEELQFRAGLRKLPKGWNPSASGRNIFLDEPYRDKTIDRLFKRSHAKINTGLLFGSLSVVGLLLLSGRICQGGSNHRRRSICARCFHRPRIWFSKAISSSVWNGLWKPNILVTAIAIMILVGLLAVAGVMPAVAIIMLLRNDGFCGNRCASSSLNASVVLEVDACIEQCSLGKGGKFAILASCLWFLVLLMVLVVAAISIIVAKTPLPSLSRKKWWNDVCLALAIRSEQLYNPPALPLSHDHHKL